MFGAVFTFGHTGAVTFYRELGLMDRGVEVNFNIKGIQIHHPNTCLVAQHAAEKGVECCPKILNKNMSNKSGLSLNTKV